MGKEIVTGSVMSAQEAAPSGVCYCWFNSRKSGHQLCSMPKKYYPFTAVKTLHRVA